MLKKMLTYLVKKRLINGGRPNFLIVGAQKGGTTALFDYLIQSPNLIPPVTKELHYFDQLKNQNEASLNNYQKLFINSKIKRELGLQTFEATPFMHHPHIPKIISSWYSDIKLVFVLRDPVKRALSHYMHNKRKGREEISFQEAIEREQDRIGEHIERINRLEVWNSLEYSNYSYKYRGCYKNQLDNWLQSFKKEQCFFINSNDLKNDTQRICNELSIFLGLSTFKLQDTSHKHVGSKPDIVSEDFLGSLRKYFEYENKGLKDLVGFDFN